MLNVECTCIQSWLLEVLLFNWIFGSCSLTNGRCNVIENHEKSYWSFQMTSNLICLWYKTMHGSVTWMDLYTLQLLVSYTEDSSFTKLRSGCSSQHVEWKSLAFSMLRVYLNVICTFSNRTIIVVVSLVFAFTWLLWHQMDLKLNTRAFLATYHAY